MARPSAARAQAEDEALIEAFLHMMRAERGASRNTVSAYTADLREFPASSPPGSQIFRSCERRDLEAYFASRAESGLAAKLGGAQAVLP